MAPKIISLVQGEDQDVHLFFTYKETKRPFSLDGATEIEVRFPKASGVLVKKLSLTELSIVGVPELGHILIPLSDAETALFKVADNQNIYAQLDFGSARHKFNKAAVLNVAKEIVPAT